MDAAPLPGCVQRGELCLLPPLTWPASPTQTPRVPSLNPESQSNLRAKTSGGQPRNGPWSSGASLPSPPLLLIPGGRAEGLAGSPGVGSSGADQPWRPQPASPLPHCQVIPQGVAPSPCIPCCLVLTDDRLFTCHEDCQTSFFRSLGTAKLGDISAVSTEPGKEYCVLVSWGWGRGCRSCRRKALTAHRGPGSP